MINSSAFSAMEFETINPTTEDAINQYKIMTKGQINNKVKKSKLHLKSGKKM